VARWGHEMRNAETGEVSALCVLTAVHMDAKTRKSCAFPPDVLEKARKLVRSYPFERSPS
jgi:acyl-CoA thioester hydrolase